MAPSTDLTSVRRAVGVAVVFFLLGCAFAFYRGGVGLTTFGSSAATVGHSSPSLAPTLDPSERAAPDPTPSTSPTTPGSGKNSGSASTGEETIQVKGPADSVKPFQTVRIRGTYRGGAETMLRVQRWEGGIWLDFPVPTTTNQSGEFTAYIEVGKPGRYWLRVRDPESGVESEPFALVVKR